MHDEGVDLHILMLMAGMQALDGTARHRGEHRDLIVIADRGCAGGRLTIDPYVGGHQAALEIGAVGSRRSLEDLRNGTTRNLGFARAGRLPESGEQSKLGHQRSPARPESE